MRRLGLKRLAVVLAAMGIFAGAAVPSASALDVGPLTVDIVVDRTNWSACGVVSDGLTGAHYTAVLSATGYETNLSQSGVILAQSSDSGNPAGPCTPGGFDSRFAIVQYALVWTSVAGTTGIMTKTCVEADLKIAIQRPPDLIDLGVSGELVDHAAMPVCTVS